MHSALKGLRKGVHDLELKLQNREEPTTSRSILWLLTLASLSLKLVLKCRQVLYTLKILHTYKAPIFTVSVGNIVAGGCGKTSLVMKIAADVNRQVAIFTRGYRAKKKDAGLVSCPSEGDEGYLLTVKLPMANVFACRNRRKYLNTAKKMGARYGILDDGFQHRKIYRDIDIVMIDGRDPFGGGYFLPRGRLRDFPSRLKEANYIGIHDPENYYFIKKEIRRFSKARVFGTRYVVREPHRWQGKKVGVFVGIGNPTAFFQMLEELNCYIVKSLQLKDHELLKNPRAFVRKCKELGAEVILCTEKDYVKLSYTEGIVPLGVEMQVVYDAPTYESMVSEITSGMRA